MKEIDSLKTQNFFYTPKLSSFYTNNIRKSLLDLNKNKIQSKNEQIIPFNLNLDNIAKNKPNQNSKGTYVQNFFKNNYTNITQNRLNNIQNHKNSFINNSFNKIDISLPYMLNNNKINLKNKIKGKLGLINCMPNNYPNIFNNNHNRENIESVEWMNYNMKKNKKEKNKDILEEIYYLQNNEDYLQMNKNIINIPRILEINKYNSYNDFKKKHSKDYLFIKKYSKKEKADSLEIKDKKEKKDFLYKNNKKEKKRKLIKYCVLSIPGSHKGVEKINQDCSLILPNINDCKNVKLFGVFDGHGIYGDKISKEVCEYFSFYFNNKKLYEKDLNNSNTKENKEFSSNKFETINLQNLKGENFQKLNKRKINKINENIRNKFKQLTPSSSKKKSLVFSRFKKISNIFNNTISKKTNLQNIYNILSSNNYFQIFNSFNKIDKILHEKYTENKICDGTGTALSFLLLFNDYSKNNNIYCERNYNKIISCNLGNTKSILITEDKIIKELNICHTPCIKEERIRIEKNGGKIDRIDWLKVGPLRVWFKEKKYPGLTITRSLGDFEAESLGILSIPDIKEFDIDEERVKIVIIGTNGIWEFLTNDKIMDTAWGFYDYDDAEGAANKIIELAGKLWKIKNPNNIPDLTVIVLYFK